MKPLLNQAQGALKNLMENAQLFQALLEIGQENLPSDIRGHLVGVSFDNQNLLLQIDEAIWATQLRFYEANLLAIYQSHFPHLELNRVKVSVLPKEIQPLKRKIHRTLPSEKDAQEMLNVSGEVHSEGLKRALINLSKRAQQAGPKS